MINLTEICNNEGGDKGDYYTHKWDNTNIAHGYSKIYEKYLESKRNDNIKLLEIGIWCEYFPGASQRIWNKYFTNITYHGVDIVDCSHLSNDNNIIHLCDQESQDSLQELCDNISNDFDIIIDDGCHKDRAILITLAKLFSKLKSGGIYFIEDLHVVDKSEIINLGTNNFKSKYLTEDENNYINDNILECHFHLNNKFCVIIKK